MKCDTCKYKKFHSAGSFYAVAEGGDDPYDYEYCAKGHWYNLEEDEDEIDDPSFNCKDYKNHE